MWRPTDSPNRRNSILPEDPALVDLFSKLSIRVNIRSDPPGAKVFLKEYGAPDSAWQLLRDHPAGAGQGSHLVLRCTDGKGRLCAGARCSDPDSRLHAARGGSRTLLERTLDPVGAVPPEMVRIPGFRQLPGIGPVDDFVMDRYEVTNKSFKEFIDNGGYQKKEYWTQPFLKNGRPLTWEAAMKEFVDQTGRPGPATWQAGNIRKERRTILSRASAGTRPPRMQSMPARLCLQCITGTSPAASTHG